MFARRVWAAARSSSRFTRVGLATSGAVIGTSFLVSPVVRAEGPVDKLDVDAPPVRLAVPLSSLVRSFAVYSIVSLPGVVDYSPKLLSLFSSIPGLREITHAVVRHTFFAQFVGGDTALDALSVVHRYRKENVGSLFAYSVEVDEEEAASGKKTNRQSPHKAIVEEMIHSIDVAADYEDHLGLPVLSRRTWVAVKISALIPDPQAFERFSTYLVHTRAPSNPPIAHPGTPTSQDLAVLQSAVSSKALSPLTPEDSVVLKDLRVDLWRICRKAQERGVKIIVDAEYTWYQPAIDAFTLDLMREFNKVPSRSIFSSSKGENVQPLIYATYQAYLRRTPLHLKHSLQDAKASGYALGVKLVRGAYHPHETAAHAQHPVQGEALPPVWLTKAETHACYNACARLLLDQVQADVSSPTRAPRIGVLFGTHNAESCDLVLQGLQERGLAKEAKDANASPVTVIGDAVAARVTFGQLYGMADALTYQLVDKTRSSTPFVIKYVPYGALQDVMPYLGRRAIENKSVLGDGGASVERRRAGEAIWKRFVG